MKTFSSTASVGSSVGCASGQSPSVGNSQQMSSSFHQIFTPVSRTDFSIQILVNHQQGSSGFLGPLGPSTASNSLASPSSALNNSTDTEFFVLPPLVEVSPQLSVSRIHSVQLSSSVGGGGSCADLIGGSGRAGACFLLRSRACLRACMYE